MIIWFEDVDGNPRWIDMPDDTSSILFADFCDFKNEEQKFFKANQENDKEGAPAVFLLNAIKYLVKGELDYLIPSIENDDAQDMIDNGFQLTLDTPISLVRVYAHLITLINSYRPKSIPKIFEIKLEGSSYFALAKKSARLLLNTPLTTGEVIEVKEYQRRANQQLDLAAMAQGNIDFNLGLTELAILIRKNGEKLPSDRAKLTEFIKERRQVFAKATLDQVIRLRFFLLRSLVDYSQTKTTNSFGKGHRVSRVQRKRKRRQT